MVAPLILCDLGWGINSCWLLGLKCVLPDSVLQSALSWGRGSASLEPGCKTLFNFFCAIGLEEKMMKKELRLSPPYDSIIESVF